MGQPDRQRRRYRQWWIAIGAIAATAALCVTIFVLRRPNAPAPDEATPADGIVTTCPKSDLLKNMSTRTYDIAEIISLLAAADGAKKSRTETVAEIKTLVTGTIDPACACGHHGGKGSIGDVGETLVVSQTAEHHESLARLLRELRMSLGGGGPQTHRLVMSPRDRLVRQQLDAKLTKFCSEDVELVPAIQFFRDVSGADIRVDWRALEAAGLKPDTGFFVNIGSMTIGKALEIVLDSFPSKESRIAYVIRDGAVMISTEDDLRRQKVFRVYDVRDLIAYIRRHEGPDAEPGDASSAVRYTIRNVIDLDSWHSTGGEYGRLCEIGGLLVITQTIANHQAIDGLLGNLRRHVKTPDLDARSYLETPTDRAVARQLETKMPQLDLENVEFEKAVLALRDISGLDLRINWRGFPKKKGGLFDKVNVYLKNVTAKEALNAILGSTRRNLGPWPCYAVIGGEIRIIPYDKLPVPIRIYDVRDLIAPICEHKGWSFNRLEALTALEILISVAVDRESWRDAGGEAGVIQKIDGLFVIRQTTANHEAIVELLACLRRYFRTRDPGPYMPFDTETGRAISRQFDVKIQRMGLEDVKLGRAIQALLDASGLNSRIRLRKPAGEDRDLARKVTVHLRDVTFREALAAVFESATEKDKDPFGPNLKYTIRAGVMKIVSPPEFRSWRVIRFYNVRDIIARRMNTARATPKAYEKAVLSIRDTIRKEIAPHSWWLSGGDCPWPDVFAGLLMVEQTKQNHQALVGLLKKLQAKTE